MKKIDLANFESFKETLLASVDVGVRIFIFSRPKSGLQRMYQHALTTAAIRHLHPHSRYHTSVELCVPDKTKALSTWWEASLILSQYYWGEWLEIAREWWAFIVGIFGSCKEPTEPGTDGNLSPPYKLFMPIPKSEVGGCARSDSLIRSLIH